MAEPQALVVCLCAEWCGVCREYRSAFDQVAALFPQMRFLWVDVEDESDLVDPIDIDDFPTLLLALGDQPRFFGIVRPQAARLEQLVREHLQREGSVLPTPEVAALLTRLRALA
ncbi:MAG: thioredoxin family protein [Burkholderiaceae bacterium]